MLRGVLDWLTVRLRGENEHDDGADESSRFIPSVLDASVRYAHGWSETDVEREIADVEKEARRLENQQDR